MPSPDLRPGLVRRPRPADAVAWIAFLARERARTYAGLVPASFEADELAHAHADADSGALADAFGRPTGHRRLLAAAAGGR